MTVQDFRIIHDSGFTAEEVHLLRRVIRENIVEAMRTMVIQSDILGVVPTDYRTQVMYGVCSITYTVYVLLNIVL
jgi:hypothetical protein